MHNIRRIIKNKSTSLLTSALLASVFLLPNTNAIAEDASKICGKGGKYGKYLCTSQLYTSSDCSGAYYETYSGPPSTGVWACTTIEAVAQREHHTKELALNTLKSNGFNSFKMIVGTANHRDQCYPLHPTP